MWLLFIILAIVLIVGNAMILWRTAKIPKFPSKLKAKPYQDEDDSSW